MQAAVTVNLASYTPERAREDVRTRRPCDWWVYQPAHPGESPLLQPYRNSIIADIESDIAAAVVAATQPPNQPEPNTAPRLSLNLSTQFAGATNRSHDSAGGLAARLSVSFRAANVVDPDADPDANACAAAAGQGGVQGGGQGGDYMLPPEHFIGATGWEVQIHNATTGNAQWVGPASPGAVAIGASLGTLQFTMDTVADLRAVFKPVNVPPYLTERVDPDAIVEYSDYTITPAYPNYSHAYLSIAAAIEITHVDTGTKVFGSIHNFSLAPGHLPDASPWTGDTWSVGTDGWIRQTNGALSFNLNAPDPAVIGLPSGGSYAMRAVLLGIGYKTEDRIINALGDTFPVASVLSMPTELSFAAGGAGLIPDWSIAFEFGGGLTLGAWAQVGTIQGIPELLAITAIGSYVLAAGSGGDVYRSGDSGATWAQVGTVAGIRYVWSMATIGSDVLAVADLGDVYRSGDSGATWAQVGTIQGWSDYYSLTTFGSDVLSIGGFSDVYRSSNHGTTWAQVGTIPGTSYSHAITAIGSYVLAAGGGGDVYRSGDSGATWAQVTTIPDFYVVSLATIGGNVLASIDSGDVYRSGDSGATWVQGGSIPGSGITSMAAIGNDVYAASISGEVYRATYQ